MNNRDLPIQTIMQVRDRDGTGRPISAKSAQARIMAIRSIAKIGRGKTFSVFDVAQNAPDTDMQDLRFALRFFESQGYLSRSEVEPAQGKMRTKGGNNRVTWKLAI
jgi:hypothetical protein